MFVNHTILLSEETLDFEYYIHSSRYIADPWTQKCVLALIFANGFKIVKFKDLAIITSCYMVY